MSPRPALLLLVVACNPPMGDDTGDTSDQGGTHAVVTTTDFSVGALATVALDSLEVQDDITLTSADPFVFVQDDTVFQVNGFGVDNVTVYAPGDFTSVLAQFSTGAGTNPHDVALVDGDLYVTLYEEAHLGIFDPADGTALGTVDLSAEAGSDGIPEASTMVRVAGRLYVALERLDRDDGWTDDGGTVVEIDPDSGLVTDSWAVGPSPVVYAHPTDPTRLVVRTGLYAQAVGGLAVLDPTEDAPEAPFADASTLGYGIAGWAAGPGGEGVLVAEHSDFTYSLKCVDLEGTVTDLYGPTGDWLTNPAVDPEGRVWVVVRSFTGDSGLMVVDPDPCEVVTDTLVETNLPPYQVAFF